MGRLTRTFAIIGLANTLVILVVFALTIKRERSESRIRRETRRSIEDREAAD